jgi:hypothetical protein
MFTFQSQGYSLARQIAQRVRHVEAALIEVAYYWPMRTAVPEYPQSCFVEKPVLAVKVSIVGAT